MNALIKIPMSVTSSILYQIAFTPPNPPPEATEAAKFADAHDLVPVKSSKVMADIGKVMVWSYVACESAVILAKAGILPPQYTNKILGHLLRTGYDASRIGTTKTAILGWALVCAGCTIRIACHRALGKYFTWELAVKKDHRLVTSGPYAVVRHPAYTGILLNAVGAVLTYVGSGSWAKECGWLNTTAGRIIAGTWLCSVVLVPALIMLRVKKEDAVMKRHFGKEWEEWAKTTPYALFPFVY